MKKIILFLAAAALLSACGKDDVRPETPSAIGIVKSDIVFDALGGTGTIKLADLDGQVTAVSASDW